MATHKKVFVVGVGMTKVSVHWVFHQGDSALSFYTLGVSNIDGGSFLVQRGGARLGLVSRTSNKQQSGVSCNLCAFTYGFLLTLQYPPPPPPPPPPPHTHTHTHMHIRSLRSLAVEKTLTTRIWPKKQVVKPCSH